MKGCESMCNIKLPNPWRPSRRKDPRLSEDIGLFSISSYSSAASSLASLRDFLPDNPNLYRFKELADATTQFTSGRMGKSSVWICVLRGKTVAVTVRNQNRKIKDFRSGISKICNAHHASIVKLLGGCCHGEQVYLVYENVQGSSLGECLRSGKAPGFTVLESWISRMQIAVDVAQGLEYMHHDSNINYVHNCIKSSSLLVTGPSYRTQICHLGVCYLAGEYEAPEIFETQGDSNTDTGARGLNRSSSMKITGTQGYMAPEYVDSGIVSQKTDVFSLGVVLQELLSGHEPIRYLQGVEGGCWLKRIGLIESLNAFLYEAGDNFTGRLRTWMDPRLMDSFPVDCAERVARLAASCVNPEPGKRRDMRYVAGELSKLFIISQQWSDGMETNKGWITATLEGR